MKEGSTLQSPGSSSSFLLSLSLSLPFFFSSPAHLHHDLSLLLSLGSPLFSSFFLLLSLFFCLSRPSTVYHSRFPVNESEFSRLYSRPPNNREHVIPYSACHTRYPPIFLPRARLTRWNLLRGNVSWTRDERNGRSKSPCSVELDVPFPSRELLLFKGE